MNCTCNENFGGQRPKCPVHEIAQYSAHQCPNCALIEPHCCSNCHTWIPDKYLSMDQSVTKKECSEEKCSHEWQCKICEAPHPEKKLLPYCAHHIESSKPEKKCDEDVKNMIEYHKMDCKKDVCWCKPEKQECVCGSCDFCKEQMNEFEEYEFREDLMDILFKIVDLSLSNEDVRDLRKKYL